jgi:acyl carrier protein
MEYIVTTASKKIGSTPNKTPAPAARVDPVATAKPVMKTVETITKVASTQSGSTLITTALDIISKESGIAEAELSDDCAFEDIGMDSLLCLMVSSRLRDELGIELSSAEFLEMGNIAGLRQFLAKHEPTPTVVASETVKETVVEALVGNHADPVAADNTWTDVQTIVSEESGIAIAELTDDTCFSDIGVDSLLSLLISSRLKEEVGVEFAHTASFLEFDTLGSLRTHVTGSRTNSLSETPTRTPSLTESPSNTPPSGTSTPSSVDETPLWSPDGQTSPKSDITSAPTTVSLDAYDAVRT